jgi:hypothetical protein
MLEQDGFKNISREVKTAILYSVFKTLSANVLEVVTEVVTEVRKTNESLSKYKERASSLAHEGVASDFDKICLQILIDVVEYEKRLFEIFGEGYKREQVGAIEEMYTLLKGSQTAYESLLKHKHFEKMHSFS